MNETFYQIVIIINENLVSKLRSIFLFVEAFLMLKIKGFPEKREKSDLLSDSNEVKLFENIDIKPIR